MLSARAHAAHRRSRGLPGGTLRAIPEAIAAERIPVGPDRCIHPAVADPAWEQNTDASRRPLTSARTREKAPDNLAEAKRLESIERTCQLRLEDDVREGHLVAIGQVEQGWSKIVVGARNHLRSLPARARQRLNLIATDVGVLAELIDEALNELADGACDKGTGSEEESAGAPTHGRASSTRCHRTAPRRNRRVSHEGD